MRTSTGLILTLSFASLAMEKHSGRWRICHDPAPEVKWPLMLRQLLPLNCVERSWSSMEECSSVFWFLVEDSAIGDVGLVGGEWLQFFGQSA